MSVNLKAGQSVVLTASDLDAAGSIDPNATDAWTSDDNGAVISLVGAGLNATATFVAAGTANVTASATDPDGNKVPSLPFPVICLANTDTASVTITAGTPTP